MTKKQHRTESTQKMYHVSFANAGVLKESSGTLLYHNDNKL